MNLFLIDDIPMKGSALEMKNCPWKQFLHTVLVSMYEFMIHGGDNRNVRKILRNYVRSLDEGNEIGTK